MLLHGQFFGNGVAGPRKLSEHQRPAREGPHATAGPIDARNPFKGRPGPALKGCWLTEGRFRVDMIIYGRERTLNSLGGSESYYINLDDSQHGSLHSSKDPW